MRPNDKAKDAKKSEQMICKIKFITYYRFNLNTYLYFANIIKIYLINKKTENRCNDSARISGISINFADG